MTSEISYEFRALSMGETHPFSFDGLTRFQPIQACRSAQRAASLASAGGKEE